jgi:cell division inhibitor SulA
MRYITTHNQQLHITATPHHSPAGTLRTGLSPIDDHAPLSRGAMHELLFDPAHAPPMFFATLIARAALSESSSPGTTNSISSYDAKPNRVLSNRMIALFDPDRTMHPRALEQQGIALEQIMIVRPPAVSDLLWALIECLRCPAVACTIARTGKLSRIDARKLQLAVERSTGVGLLLREHTRLNQTHAAASRWIIAPAPGERLLQRWLVSPTSGHGGLSPFFLEHHRDNRTLRTSIPHQNHPLHPTPQLAHQPHAAGVA